MTKTGGGLSVPLPPNMRVQRTRSSASLTTGQGVVARTPFIDVGPILCGAILTGVVAGYLLESRRSAAWSVGVGVYVLIGTWSTARWYVTPSVEALIGQGVKAIVAGALAGFVCRFVWRRRGASGNGIDLNEGLRAAYRQRFSLQESDNEE